MRLRTSEEGHRAAGELAVQRSELCDLELRLVFGDVFELSVALSRRQFRPIRFFARTDLLGSGRLATPGPAEEFL